MTLYAIDPGPLPPSCQEMAEAIETYARELLKRFAPDEVMLMDVPLLKLAERLAAVRASAKEQTNAKED